MRPIAGAFLPGALEESPGRDGLIDVAFTYTPCSTPRRWLPWDHDIGHVIVEDHGRLGQYFRRSGTTPRTERLASSGEPAEFDGSAAPSGLAEPESTAQFS